MHPVPSALLSRNRETRHLVARPLMLWQRLQACPQATLEHQRGESVHLMCRRHHGQRLGHDVACGVVTCKLQLHGLTQLDKESLPSARPGQRAQASGSFYWWKSQVCTWQFTFCSPVVHRLSARSLQHPQFLEESLGKSELSWHEHTRLSSGGFLEPMSGVPDGAPPAVEAAKPHATHHGPLLAGPLPTVASVLGD